MPYVADAVANEFLTIAEMQHISVTPMKLQKLVYFAHGWGLGIFGKPLISEVIQAWKWGPVISSLYTEFREFANRPIDRLATEVQFEGGSLIWSTPMCTDKEDYSAELAKALVNRVWDVYGRFTAVQLSNMTHAAGTPWHSVMSKFPPDSIPKRLTIPNELIRDYFKTVCQGEQSF